MHDLIDLDAIYKRLPVGYVMLARRRNLIRQYYEEGVLGYVVHTSEFFNEGWQPATGWSSRGLSDEAILNGLSALRYAVMENSVAYEDCVARGIEFYKPSSLRPAPPHSF